MLLATRGSQGFIAAASMNRAGKIGDMLARAIVTL